MGLRECLMLVLKRNQFAERQGEEVRRQGEGVRRQSEGSWQVRECRTDLWAVYKFLEDPGICWERDKLPLTTNTTRATHICVLLGSTSPNTHRETWEDFWLHLLFWTFCSSMF